MTPEYNTIYNAALEVAPSVISSKLFGLTFMAILLFAFAAFSIYLCINTKERDRCDGQNFMCALLVFAVSLVFCIVVSNIIEVRGETAEYRAHKITIELLKKDNYP